MEDEPRRCAAAMPLMERDREDRSDRLGGDKPGTSTSSIPVNDHRHGSAFNANETPVTSMPEMRSLGATSVNISRSGSSNGASTTVAEIPPIQVMERTDESGNPKPYKFPSSVFMRNKSTAPMEWSTASNESLFSIHNGNASFNKDMSGLGRSGEPVMPVAPFSTEFTNFSVSNTLTKRGSNAWNAAVNMDSRPVDSRPLAPGMQMQPHSNNSISSLGGSSNHYTSQSSHRSDASGASIKSFAFPILAGDDRGNSQKTARVDSSTKPQMHFKKSQHEPPTPRTTEIPNKPAQNTPQGGWFSWLSCTNCS